MKSSIYNVCLLSFAISMFPSFAQADGVTKVQLSTTPILIHTVVKAKPHYVIKKSSRFIVKKRSKRASRKISRSRKYAPRSYKRTMRSKARYKARNRAKTKYTFKYHHIKRGDSIYGIARKYGVTVKHLIRVNTLKSTTIKVGGVIKI